MSYIRKISIGFASGLANGFLFYMIAQVANTVITAINPIVAFLIGLGTSVAISLAKAEDEKKEK